MQESVERLYTVHEHAGEEEAVKPMWTTFEVDKRGKMVTVRVPWKRSKPAEQTAACRAMHDECAASVSPAC
jgi:hypothetical protein